MRRINYTLAICMLLWVQIASGQRTSAGQVAPVQARNQPGTTYICVTTPSDPTMYRSGVFQTAPNTSLAAITNAWDTHVRQTYHHAVSGSRCLDQFYDPTGQRYIQQLEQTAKTFKSQIVIVDWKYVPGQDTPTAAAAQPPATAVAAPSRTWLIYCASLTGPVVYVSDKFEVPPFGPGGTVKIPVAFHQFLHEKYSLPTDIQSAPIQCGVDRGVGGSERSITAVEANIEANAKQGKKIVKTGWKYDGPLPPPPPLSP